MTKFGPMECFDPSYEVTGTLSPNATGTYEPAGILNGKSYYAGGVVPHYLFWNDMVGWWIDPVLGDINPPSWQRDFPDIEGTYLPQAPATGDATVTKI